MTYRNVNITLQLIFEWFKINWFLSNTSKTFVFNFSLAKTLTHTLNIILDNQNFTLTESIKFFGMHSDNNVSWTLHTEHFFEDIEYAWYMIRNLYYYLNVDSLFCTFSVIGAIWDSFLWLSTKST